MNIINEIIQIDKLNKNINRLKKHEYTTNEINKIINIQKQVEQNIKIDNVMKIFEKIF